MILATISSKKQETLDIFKVYMHSTMNPHVPTTVVVRWPKLCYSQLCNQNHISFLVDTYFPLITIVKKCTALQAVQSSSLNFEFECNNMQYYLLTHIFNALLISQEWIRISYDYLHQDQEYYLQTSHQKNNMLGLKTIKST